MRDVLKHHEHQTGEARPLSPISVKRAGRQRHLPAALRERLWKMHRTEGQPLRQIADWLKRSGVKTATGKTNWSPGTILYIVRGVEIERAQIGSA